MINQCNRAFEVISRSVSALLDYLLGCGIVT